jgi:Mce-associated membrane protein
VTSSEESKADRASDISEEPKVDRASDISEEPTGEVPAGDELTGEPETESSESSGHGTAASPVQRVLSWCRQRRVAVLALGLVLASALAAGSVYWWLYRPDQLTGEVAQQEVVAAAKEGIEAALSYSPESLEKDLDTAKSHLTGKFLDYYSDFTAKVVTPAATQKGVKTEANVARAAVSQIRPGHADVLVFVNQVTTSKDRPTPALATSTVMVTMVKSGDRWLIAEFNPV